MNLNKLLRTALKTGLYFLEQSDKATAPIRKQVKDQVEGLTDRTRQAILGPEDHTVRNAVSLAAGIGLGIALGMLFAPASGEEIRRSIVEKAQDARAKSEDDFLLKRIRRRLMRNEPVVRSSLERGHCAKGRPHGIPTDHLRYGDISTAVRLKPHHCPLHFSGRR